MDKLTIAIKVSELVSNGWTFRNFDSVVYGGRVMAEHSNGGTWFFDNDDEFVEWLREQ